MSKRKKEKGKRQPQGFGQFKCGKCGDAFPKAHGLAIHILRTHKRTWGKSSASKPQAKPVAPVRPAAKPSQAEIVRICAKCKRRDFKSGASYAAHCRYCKGLVPTVLTTPSVLSPATPPPQRRVAYAGILRKTNAASGNGHNQIDRLKSLAAEKRREAEEIDKLIVSFESFEVSAQKFLK